MTNKEKEMINNDNRYCVIYWRTGKIFTKRSLIELRAKRIEKLFKGEEYHIRPCTYNDYFMASVSVTYIRLRKYVKWRCERYNEVFYFDEEGHIQFKDKYEL